ncbi:MAG: flagellar biosynthetic protein FliQ, partial [Planctomycetota bacterium]
AMVIDDEMLGMVRAALLLVMKVALPVLLSGITVGLTVSVFQSLTQVQEMTLSMVPKIFAMLVVTVLLLPWIAAMVGRFTVECFELVTPI